MTGEIVVILLAAFCVFLFCSNLGLCGKIGQWMNHFMRGTMGIFGYVFPILLPIGALFAVLAKNKLRIGIKLAAAVIVFTIFCGIVELIVGKFTAGTMEWMEFYRRSVTEAGGGLAGAIWCKLLYPSLGLFGSYLVMVALCLIGLLLITEKSLLTPIKHGSERVYSTAREDMERRREEKEIRRRQREADREEKLSQEREERRYRMNNPVRGSMTNIRIGEPEDSPVSGANYRGMINGVPVAMTPEELERENGTEEIIYTDKSEKKKRKTRSVDSPEPVRPEPERQVKIQSRSTEPEVAQSVQEMTITGLDGLAELQNDDAITARQESRTLSELESLDSLHSGFSRQRAGAVPDILFTPEDHLESRPDDGTPIEAERPDAPMVEEPPLTVQELRQNVQELRQDNQISEPEISPVEPEISPVKPENPAPSERGGDVLRVVTANGRVIEVDNDPTTDPLAAKRAGLSQGQAGMTNQSLVRGESTVSGKSAAEPLRTESTAVARETNRSSQDLGSRNSQSTPERKAASQAAAAAAEKPKRVVKPYEKPPLRLLNAPQKKAGVNKESDLRETAMKLQQTLKNFGVGATVTNISCGPSVTRYELIPDQGVKVSKFLSLTDDIKLNLAAADIRMEAPIPGKSAIGIEVPNKEKTSVCLREVMESEEFLKHPSKLAVAVGKDIAGNNIVADLARMPHLLVAGTTGSGKSVFVNTMIVSMLYKATPDEVKFIMIDPKMVEFRIYNGIPHLLSPVVTDPKKAAEVLGWAVLQMTDRYKKFAELNVRDIKGYNQKCKEEAAEGEKPELMPQIVIVVDELSDLMMAAPNEVEDSIVRLAQMARAAGIHLILATQRPSVNVVTGLIKANIPSRVALSVSTGVDSRTIIDMNGAEKLLGNGDMLFYPSGYQKPLRVQGAFVSDKEILQLVNFLSERGEAKFDESIENRLEQSASGNVPASDRDEYFERAGKFITESKKASIGNLQRMFKIGFNRAARIMDQLAEAGVVGAEEGTKARKILMTPEEFEEYLGRR